MTKHLALVALLISTFFAQVSYSQACGNSGSAVCVPGTGMSYMDGFRPKYDSLPCIVQGVYFDTVIRFVVPPTVTSGSSTYDLNWLQLTELSNLPCGLCWATNKTDNKFNKNEQACIRVSGTTYDNPGQFKLNIIVSVNVKFGPINVTQDNQNASQAGLKYFLKVQAPGGVCTPVDSNAVGNTAITPGANFTATATAGGATTFCQGGSVTLTAAPTQATLYQWYNGSTAISGATSPTYTPTTPGNYNVKVAKGCKAFTSSNVAVTVNPLPASAITPIGPVQLCNGSTQLLTATPAGATYAWLNNGNPIGKTTDTNTVSTSGNYSVSVTQNGCSSVSNVVSVSTGGSSAVVNPTASSNTICPNQTVTLDAGAGFSSYSWSGGGTGQQKSVTTSGTYTVTVTLSNGGCTSIGSGSVTITNGQNVPAVTTLSPTTDGCQGTAIVLDAGTGYDSYSWTGGSTSQTFTPTASGPYSVTVTKNGFCGNATATTNVNIKPLPQINLALTPNPAVACPNIPVTLDAGQGYDTYAWSNNASTQTIQGDLDSTYQVTVTLAANGCTATANATVTVANAGPPDSTQVAPAYSVCSGDSVYISAGVGYATYQWSTGGSSDFIRAKTGGTYSVTVTQADKCGTLVASTEVTENTRPDASFTNNSGTLSANTTTGVTYQWYKDNAPVNGATSATYTPTSSGNYALQVNDGKCSSRSSALSISVGLNETAKAIALSAAPNPTSGIVAVRFNLPTASELEFTITDITGKVLQTNKSYFNAGNGSEQVDLSGFSNGIYLLTVQTKEGKATVIMNKN